MAANIYRTETLEVQGRTFRVDIVYDDDQEPPWEQSEGHGPVRFISDRESLGPGETVLYDSRHGRYVYNIREAVRASILGKWGRPDKVTRETIGRYMRKPAHRVSAIDADMHYLRGWCNESWFFVGVCVRIIGADGEPEGDIYDNAVWRVESFGDHWREVATGIADGILRAQ